jgi:hypothetical protein
VAQVVGLLPSKCEAEFKTPVLPQKKKFSILLISGQICNLFLSKNKMTITIPPPSIINIKMIITNDITLGIISMHLAV